MADFNLFGLLGGGGDSGQAQAPAAPQQSLADVYGLPQQIIDQQRMSALGAVGAKLLAAAQAGPIGQRGQILSQIGSIADDANRGLLNAAQLRLYGTQQQKMALEMEQNKQLTTGLQRMLTGGAGIPTATAPAAGVGGGAPAPGVTGGAPAPGVSVGAPAGSVAGGGGGGGAPGQEGDVLPGINRAMAANLAVQAARDPMAVAKEIYERGKSIYDRDQWVTVGNGPDGYEIQQNIKTGEKRYQQINPGVAAETLARQGSEELAKLRTAAQTQADSIARIHMLRQGLDDGIYSGRAADWQLGAAKIATASGLAGQQLKDTVGRTEAFQSFVGSQVMEMARQLGANPSNADREYAQKVAAGDIKLDENSIRRILDQNEKMARTEIQRYNDRASAVVPNVPGARASGATAFYGPIQQPAEYQRQAAASPTVQPAPGAARAPGAAPSAGSWLPQGARVLQQRTAGGQVYAQVQMPDGSIRVIRPNGGQ